MAKPKTVTVTCHVCGDPFESKVKVMVRNGKRWECTRTKRRSCPKCKKLYQKKWESEAGRDKRLKVLPGEKATKYVRVCKLEEVAKSLGTRLQHARVIERKALQKIRSNPELVEAFRQWIADGGRVPIQADIGESLLDYMLEMSQWYATYNQLLDNGKQKEALECRLEIENFHKAFKKELSKLSVINE